MPEKKSSDTVMMNEVVDAVKARGWITYNEASDVIAKTDLYHQESLLRSARFRDLRLAVRHSVDDTSERPVHTVGRRLLGVQQLRQPGYLRH